MSRPLSPMERALWKLDLGAPLNFTTIAKVKGPLSDEALRAALPALRARHPHLRERIVEGAFVTDGVPELSLEVGDAEWTQVADRELNTPVTAPLARFVRVGPRLLVTLHHAIGDGMSGVYLVRDWLRAATGVALEPLTDAGGIDTLLPAVLGVGNHARFIARELWVAATSGLPVKVRPDAPVFAYDRKARVVPLMLEADVVTRLRERARAEKTTVHGALSAAMVLGLLCDAGVKRGGIQFGSPVNVRAQLVPSPGEGLGFYVSASGFRAAVRADVPFWELARAVRRQLEADLRRRAEISMVRMVPGLLSLIRAERLEPRALIERWERTLPTSTGLTNLGPLGVETSFGGGLELEECHFAACPSALGDFLSTATSLHGRLFWNFIWTEPRFSAAHARALIESIQARLISAI